MRIIFEVLTAIHDRKDFDCGSVALNLFLRDQANQRQKKYNAVTHVAVDLESAKVPKTIYGYYTLSNYSLEYDLLPPLEAKKTSPKEKVPVLKLGRIARNRLYTNPGFGEIILIDMFKKALSLSAEVGFYLIDVDILNESLGDFYRKYGFKEFLRDPKHMFITMETVKKLFG